VVELAEDPDGDMITSLVVVPAESETIKPPEPRLTPNQQTMLTLLDAAGASGLTTEAWNEKAREAGLGSKRRADLVDFREALKGRKLALQYGDRWIAARHVQGAMFDDE
jgi:hypothetical protein